MEVRQHLFTVYNVNEDFAAKGSTVMCITYLPFLVKCFSNISPLAITLFFPIGTEIQISITQLSGQEHICLPPTLCCFLFSS